MLATCCVEATLFKELEHGRLKIIRVDDSSGTDQACEPHRHESAAGPHIGDDHSGLDPNQLQRSIGLFLLLAGGAIEPSGIRVDASGNLPSSQGMLGRGLCGVKALGREAEKQTEGDRRGQTPRSP